MPKHGICHAVQLKRIHLFTKLSFSSRDCCYFQKVFCRFSIIRREYVTDFVAKKVLFLPQKLSGHYLFYKQTKSLKDLCMQPSWWHKLYYLRAVRLVQSEPLLICRTTLRRKLFNLSDGTGTKSRHAKNYYVSQTSVLFLVYH